MILRIETDFGYFLSNGQNQRMNSCGGEDCSVYKARRINLPYEEFCNALIITGYIYIPRKIFVDA